MKSLSKLSTFIFLASCKSFWKDGTSILSFPAHPTLYINIITLVYISYDYDNMNDDDDDDSGKNGWSNLPNLETKACCFFSLHIASYLRRDCADHVWYFLYIRDV